MILVDANLLVYAHRDTAPLHHAARSWLTGVLGGSARVGLPWPSILAYLRLTTNPRIFEFPLSVEAAWGDVAIWLGRPCVWIPHPTRDHAAVLERLLVATAATANLVPDAHLAALAIEHGLTLMSADRGFARFPGLRLANPLAPGNA